MDDVGRIKGLRKYIRKKRLAATRNSNHDDRMGLAET